MSGEILHTEENFEKLLKFVEGLSKLTKVGFDPLLPEEAHENGNYDDAYQGGYEAADHETAEAARFILGELTI